MSALRAVREILLNAITVSGVVERRVYPLRLQPDTDFPAITYGQVMGQRVDRHDGPATLRLKYIQISCWARRIIEAEDLAERVSASLDGYSGNSANVTVQQIIVLDDPGHMYDPETQLFHVPVDVLVAHDA